MLAYCAIIGNRYALPGRQRVRVSNKPDFAFVDIVHFRVFYLCNLDGIDVSDCTIFCLEHLGLTLDLNSQSSADEVLERSLIAINEAVLWTKAMERLQQAQSFARQVGRADVKLLVIQRSDGKQIAWANGTYQMQHANAFVAQLFANTYSSQIAENPLHPVIRRVMASVDLFNLGFYTEAFITLFSLVDDLTQNVVKSGLAQRGLDEKQQDTLMMSIKEGRLEKYLEIVIKVAGGRALSDDDADLATALKRANSDRNNVMHDSTRLERDQADAHLGTLLSVLDWLRANPFAFFIPPFPVLAPARSQFALLEPITQMPVATGGPECESPGKLPHRCRQH